MLYLLADLLFKNF